MGTELSGKCFGLKKKTPRHNSYGKNTSKWWEGKDGYCEESNAFSEGAFRCHRTMWSQRAENFAQDLNLHQYKIVIFQELSDGDMANRKIST